MIAEKEEEGLERNEIHLEKISSAGKKVFWKVELTGSTICYEWGQFNKMPQKISQTISSGKNIGKVNETTKEQQALVEARSKANKKIDSGYQVVFQSGKFSSASGLSLNKARQIIKPMLAYPYESSDFQNEKEVYFVQPKLDGIRCIADRSGNLWSRQGKKIDGVPHIEKSVQSFFAMLSNDVEFLDGELYSHTLSFQEITSLVRKGVNIAIKEAKAVDYHIYDVVQGTTSFVERFYNPIYCAILLMPEHIHVVLTNTANNTEFDSIHDRYVNSGYEGMMIRKHDLPYEYKRTHQLTKYKKFHQEEYEIVDVEKEEHRDALGSFLLLLSEKDQTFFNARPSFTEEEKMNIWNDKDEYIGKIATVKFQEFSNENVPRFPVVVGIRHSDDL